MAKEWGRFNINVNAVAYGFIETRLTQAKEKAEKIEREGKQVDLGIPEEMRQMAVRFIPLGRPGTPDEAAGPVLFLASPLSDYVSGHILLVTGGSYM
jgi:3-oxoacyl-[acyl-carrier protein] reductase